VFLQNQCEDYSCTFLSAGDDPRLPVLGGLHKSSKFAKKVNLRAERCQTVINCLMFSLSR
jgi:hypothetical protein